MTIITNASGQFGISEFTVSATAGKASHTTIQAAVTASGGSGSIFIYPGLYNESIAWPAGISVIGSSTGENTFDVSITGNQTFTGGGNLSFENIAFSAGASDVWTQSSPASNAILEFKNCGISNTGGKGIVLGSGGGNISSLFMESTSINASTQALDISGAGTTTSNLLLCSLNTTGAVNTVDVTGTSTNVVIDSTLISTSSASANSCVAANSATSTVTSRNSRYNAGNLANASAFLFSAAGTIRSRKDEMTVNTGTFWARSTGAFGALTYGSTIINTGTTLLIDPQITATLLTTLVPDAIGITWSDRGVSATVASNTGSVSTAAIALTLPAAPTNGDVCSFILGAALALTVTANAGQTVRVGSTISAAAGTAVASVLGNSLTLVYNTTLSSWMAESVIGNWIIT